MAGTLEIPTIGSANAVADPKVKANFETINNKLNASNNIPNTWLAENKFTWYTPKAIATEQTRESTSFGALTTADEITGVVLPENGLIQIGYVAKVKSSVAAAGRTAVFLSANQLKDTGSAAVVESSTGGTGFNTVSTVSTGLTTLEGTAAFVTTGQPVATQVNGGLLTVFAAAGTYAISVQFRATSGNITAKERKLWVAVMGA